MMLYDYIEAGFRVFGIHGVDAKGVCGCGDPECPALFKHPVVSRWQSVPDWSEEQLDTFHQMGHFDTGFGVLCSGWLIIDVDARNGGVESFARLCADLPSCGSSKFVVNTGSGGGSQHHYFKMSEPAALMQSHEKYQGIDFKASGYVIGCGSMHASGMAYDAERGHPQDIGEAPTDLIEMLRKPSHYRVATDGGEIDVDADHIADLLSHVPAGCGYDQWIKIGMAVHHCTSGSGFDIWDSWSSGGDGYPGSDQLHRHWHSFGKSSTPAGYGTLIHYAREGGYIEPVTFVYEEEEQYETASTGDEIDTGSVDLNRPPGFVGELTAWINGQCLYPRESLSVAAALCSVSGLAGMRHIDELDGMTPNMMAFCVAGSGTGKEAVQQAYLRIMKEAGVQAAVHGAFKSEQELLRNFIRHQAAFYSVDELGLVLRKLDNASKKGGASYLEGIIGMIMSIYSKANGFLPVSGDLKEEIREKIMGELSRIEKRIDNLPADDSSAFALAKLETRKERAEQALDTIDQGIDSPYLTMLGYTTPVTFDGLMGYEQATNGFLARAMIFQDLESNPRRKQGFKKARMTEQLAGAIRALYAPGVYDMMDAGDRVEHTGDKTPIPTTEDGRKLLDRVYDAFHALAETHKGVSGLQAIPRRGYEIASKVSLILSLPGGVRTYDHVLWGYALAMRDVRGKIRMAMAEDLKGTASGDAARLLSLLSVDHGETAAVIKNRLRISKEQTEALIAQLVTAGRIIEKNMGKAKNGRECIKYFAPS